MAHITLTGTLLTPAGKTAYRDQIRFTHKSTTGETVKSSVDLLTIIASGFYHVELEYGLVLIEYKSANDSQFKNLGVATVNGTNPSTSIPELLNGLVPVSSAELIQFQAILADTVTAKNDSVIARDEAEAFAASIDLINDLSQAYIFDTVAAATTTTINFPVGKGLTIKERTAGNGGGAKWYIVSGEVPNNYDIVAHDTLPLQLKLDTVGDINLRQLGGVAASDNTGVINRAFAIKELTGGIIHVDDLFKYSTPIVFDTSTSKQQITFKGNGTRISGFRYTGTDNATDAALEIGVSGVSGSGFVEMLDIGVYGLGQDIDGVKIFQGQRYCQLAEFTVRTFNGMLLQAGNGDIYLNTWGAIYLLNGARGCTFGPEFNANDIGNIIIENINLASARFTNEDPVAVVDGIGTHISTISIESTSPPKCLKLKNSVTVTALYQEANHSDNVAVNARPLIMSGAKSIVLGGNIKLPGTNPDTSGFYVIDLDDSVGAEVTLNITTPTPNPNSYQKPILWGTSKNAVINCAWRILDGITYPSRREGEAFNGENKSNHTLDGIKMVFGQHPELVGRELMTTYCLNNFVGRCISPNSNNRVDGFIESNIAAGSRLERGFGFSKRKDTLKLSAATVGDYGVYQDFVLDPTHIYLFSSFLGRKVGDESLPKIKVTDLFGTQNYTISPKVTDFRGWTQVSLITPILDATSVRFWSMISDSGAGFTHLGMSFLIDLTQYEIDHGVSFSGMTTRQIESLIKPSYISSEFEMQSRSTAPTYGAYQRGDKTYRYPPTVGAPEGYVCTVSGDFASTAPVFAAMANLV